MRFEKADIYNDLYDDFRMPVQKPIVKEKKVYPNDPCPCGSGKKYKKMLWKKNSNGDFKYAKTVHFLQKTDSIRKIQEKKQKTRNQQNFYMIWEI